MVPDENVFALFTTCALNPATEIAAVDPSARTASAAAANACHERGLTCAFRIGKGSLGLANSRSRNSGLHDAKSHAVDALTMR
jgi:hypothetical protein